MNKHGNLTGAKAPGGYSLFMMIALVFALYSCFKSSDFENIQSPDWEYNVALPLVNSTFKIEDFLNDSGGLIVINPDHSLTLTYEAKNLFTGSVNEKMAVPNQQFTVPFPLILNNTGVGEVDSVITTLAQSLTPPKEGQFLDSITFESGQLKIVVETNLNKNTSQIAAEIPSIIASNGQPISYRDTYNNPQQLELVTREIIYDLAGATLVLDNSPGNVNKISFRSRVVYTGDNNPDLSPYNLKFKVSMTNIKFSGMYGYIGQYDYQLNDTVQIELFKNNLQGNIDFYPGALKLTMDIENSFGVPFSITVDPLTAYSDFNAPYVVPVHLFGNGVANVINILGPDYSQIGQTVHNPVNTNQSNIVDAIAISPGLFVFNVVGLTNPAGNPAEKNFVLKESMFRVNAKVELDLAGAISNYQLQDTLDFTFDNLQRVGEMLFRTTVINGFPLNVSFQGIFTDENFNVLDSLISNSDEMIFAGGELGGPPDFKVLNPNSKVTDIIVSDARLANLEKAKKIMIRASLQTTNGQMAKFYSDYFVSFKMGTFVKYKLSD